jgi:tetratricopeptide (TPR) repeat protein
MRPVSIVMTRWRRWYAGVRAGGVYGRALARFYRRKYDEAALLFERAEQLDPDTDRLHFNHALRGRCYRALGQYGPALHYLSRAYEPYCAQREALHSDYSKREFIEFLSAFSDVLLRTGQVERAEDIARQRSDARRRWGIA